MIQLGSIVRDPITGFEGIATAKIEYMNGCRQICVTGRELREGKLHELWVDEPQVETIQKGGAADWLIDGEAPSPPPGGSGSIPPPRSHP